MKKVSKHKIGVLGLWVSSVGALISSAAVIEDPNIVTISVTSGIGYHPVLVSSFGLKIGLLMVILGFVFQIYEKSMKDGEEWETSTVIFTYTFVTFLIYFLFLFVSKLLFI